MTTSPLAVLVLAAGKGTRMRSRHPKVLHAIAGRPMIDYVLETARALDPARLAVVIGPDMPELGGHLAPHDVIVQAERLGTGHAVMAASDWLAGFAGDVLVLFGDTPRLTLATLARLIARRRQAPEPAAVVLGMRPGDPGAYGRLIGAANGDLMAIVEYRDASPAERAVPLCNSGVMALDGARLAALLAALDNRNAKGEYYLTDVVAHARRMGGTAAYIEAPAGELIGINSRADLAAVEAAVQSELRARALDGGATLVDPASVFFSHDTVLGEDVVVEPGVVFGPGVRIGDGVTIRAFCHLVGAIVEAGATIGPFARLRPGAAIGPEAHIGNFVEVKNATIGAGAKARHLSYIGDASVGTRATIGAGTITCNYDGVTKSRTEIGAGAFIGSNTALVAPVRIGEGAVVGAGSVITADVPADALGLTRAPQQAVEGWAQRSRARSATRTPKRKNG